MYAIRSYYDIVLAPPHSVPKTSSGKIRRFASRERYQQHQLEKRPRAIWWQLVRLSLMGLGQQGGRIWRGLREWAYAGYGWLLFALVVPGFWFVITSYSIHYTKLYESSHW